MAQADNRSNVDSPVVANDEGVKLLIVLRDRCNASAFRRKVLRRDPGGRRISWRAITPVAEASDLSDVNRSIIPDNENVELIGGLVCGRNWRARWGELLWRNGRRR